MCMQVRLRARAIEGMDVFGYTLQNAIDTSQGEKRPFSKNAQRRLPQLVATVVADDSKLR